MIAPSRSRPGTQAVTRAVGLLKAFSDARPAWRLSDLAKNARLHKATAHRLLAALEREGMVTRDPSGELYRLGPEAIALGARAARASDLRALARPSLLALSAATGETATLDVPVEGDMLILDEVPGAALVGASPEIGTRWPAHATSTGRAVLAMLGEAEQRALVRGRLSRHTDRTITSPAALARELVRVRRRGYAVAAEELERGYVAVGAAVRDQHGRPIAALCVGGPALRFAAARIPELGARVRDAADRVSAQLGFRETP